jgi:hypothetical protein
MIRMSRLLVAGIAIGLCLGAATPGAAPASQSPVPSIVRLQLSPWGAEALMPVPASFRVLPPTWPVETRRVARRAGFGVFDLRLEPQEAAVAIDGERWIPVEPGRVVADLAAGTHHVRVSCRGYASVGFDVLIEANARRVMTLSLAPPTE